MAPAAARLLCLLIVWLAAMATTQAQTFLTSVDVGATGVAGNTFRAPRSAGYTLNGAGEEGLAARSSADSTHFAYTQLTGDGQVIARLRGFQGDAPAGARAGLMIRAGLTAEAAHGSVLSDPDGGAYYVNRATAGEMSVSMPARDQAAPRWLKLLRVGNQVTGLVSDDGVAWASVGQATLALPDTVYVGLVATSGANSRLCAAMFDQAQVIPGTVVDRAAPGITAELRLDASADSFAKLSWAAAGDDVGIKSYGIYEGDALVGVVPGTQRSFVDGLLSPATSYEFSVKAFDLADHAGPLSLTLGMTTAPATLPAPWLHHDVGNVGAGGAATLADATFTLEGAGAGADETGSDAFHFAYQNLAGDGELVARVKAVGNTNPPAVEGVMLRRSLDQGARYALMAIRANKTLAFQTRAIKGGAASTVTARVAPEAFPYWVKIKRVGARVFGYFSVDGLDWTLAGAGEVPLGSRATYAGLMVASGGDPVLARAQFDSVSLRTEPIADPQAPATPGAPALAEAPSGDSVRLSWAGTADNVGVTGYEVLRDGIVIATVAGLGYADTGLAPNMSYSYSLRAVDHAGNISAGGPTLVATTGAPDIKARSAATAGSGPVTNAVPSGPTGLGAVPGNAQVALTWTAVSGATSYSIKRGTATGGPYTIVKTGQTTANYINTGLTNGTKYYYVVSATNASGEGANSSEVNATPVAPPATPTGLAATPGNTQVALSWTAVSGATGYSIKRAATSGGPYTTVKTGQTSSPYTNTGLTNGTTYYFVVSATNAGGESANSAQVGATPAVPPAAPASLVATPGNAQVTLSWNAVSGAASYSIKRATTSGGPYTTIKTGQTTPGYANTGLTNGTLYYFVVSAVGSTGVEGANSAQVSATPAVPPGAPTGVSAAPGNAQVTLAWTAVSGASGYSVKRATASGGPYTTIKAGQTSSPYLDTGLANGTPYYYVVSATNAGGESANSPQVGAMPVAPPAAPTGLTVSVASGQVTLGWTAVGGATGYSIKRATVSGGPYTTVKTGQASSPYTNTGLTNGTLYYFVVSATNPGGESANSSQVGATPVAPPSAPGGLTAHGGTAQVTLAWNAVATAASYTLKRATVSGGPYTSLQTGVTATTCTDASAANATKYYYVVSATNAAAEGANSGAVNATPLAAPAGLSIIAGSGQSTLYWGAVSAATGYSVKRATTTGGPYTTVKTGQTTASYTDTGLTNGTPYFYVVSATDTGGESDNSSQGSATPAAAPAAAAQGAYHSLRLRPDGTVWASGNNSNGQVGDNTTTTRLGPVAVNTLSGITAISAGDYHSAALKYDGSVWMWGANYDGQLGDGSTSDRHAPKQITALNNAGIIRLSAGSAFTAALSGDGTVWSFGVNYYGQLGDGTTTQRTAPVHLTGLTNIVSLSCGSGHGLALQSGGHLYAWGSNYDGEAGAGSIGGYFTTPFQIGGLSNVTAVSAGDYHSLALDNQGRVWAWGNNSHGQLGDGTTTTTGTPQLVPSLSNIVAVCAGAGFSLALRNDGSVYAWGNNSSGQLGDGTTIQRSVPEILTGISSPVAFSGTVEGGAALMASGSLWVWGGNSNGAFGNGTTLGSLIPINADAPVVTSTTSANAASWQSFNYQITTALNNATGYNAVGLPAGLSLNAATGLISGIPTAGGASNIVLSAQNAAGTSQPVTLALSTRAEANLAYGGVASALTTPNAGAPPSAAADGDPATVWTSAASDPQWLTFDLGRNANINAMVLTWGSGGIGAAYQLQVSSDNSTWTPVATVSGNASAGPLTYAGLNATGRYVRLYATARVNPGAGYSVGELAVYGNLSAVFPTVGGVRLHLQADAGIVASGTSISQWNDQSGSGNNATTVNTGQSPALTTNVLNGQPVVHLNGSCLFQLPGGLFSGVTQAEIVAVVRATPSPAGGRDGLWCFSDAGEIDSYSNVATDTFYPYDDGAIYETFGSNKQYGPIIPQTPLNQFHVYDVAATATWTARLDEKSLFAATGNTPYFSAAKGYTLGAARDPNQSFQGDFAEVLIFDHALSDADRLAVEEYLTSKYALASAPLTPSGLGATALSPTQVSLNWQYPLGSSAIRFTIQRTAAGTTNYQTIGTIENSRSFIDNAVGSGLAYSYRVIAVDLAGDPSAPSAATVVTTPVSGAVLPTSGLALWLEAGTGTPNSGGVSTWIDLSGNGNDARRSVASNQPTVVANALNGLPVVHFEGASSQSLALPDFLSSASAGEMFTVHRSTAPTGTLNGFHSFSRSSGYYPWYTPPNTSSVFQDGYIYDGFGNDAFGPASKPIEDVRQFHLFEALLQPGLWSNWMNGVLLSSSSNSTVDFRRDPLLGGDGQTFFSGDVAEILVYNRALSPNERASVESYLYGKYALIVSATPTNLQAAAVAAGQLRLNWNVSANTIIDTRFLVERKTAGGSYAQIAEVVNALSFTDSTVTAGTAYTYRVRAAQLGSLSGYSGEASATSLAPLALPVSVGLKLWLKADTGASGAVSRWADQSGLGNDAVQTNSPAQPATVGNTLNGHAVARFNAAQNTSLNLPNFMAGESAGEIFLVHRPTSPAGVANGFHSFGTGGGGAYPYSDGGIYDDFGSGTAGYATGHPGEDPTVFHLYDAASTPAHWTNRVDGRGQFTSLTNTVSFTSSPALGVSTQAGNAAYFTGDVAEVLVYNRQLSDAERSTLENYLAAKYLLLDMDPDRDGLTTRQEIALGTNPLNPDTNGDGIPDGVEYYEGYNPAAGGNVPLAASAARNPNANALDYYSPTGGTPPAPNAGAPVLTLNCPPGVTLQP